MVIVDGVVDVDRSHGLLDLGNAAFAGSVRSLVADAQRGQGDDGAVLNGLAALILASPEADLELSKSQNTALGAAPWATLNAACCRDVALIRVPPGLALQVPILVESYASSDAVSHPRLIVDVGAGASAKVTQHFFGDANSVTNARTTFVVGEGAKVDHVTTTSTDSEAAHLEHVHATVATGGALSSGCLSTAAGLARIGIDVELAGENARCDLKALQLGTDRQALDYRTQVRHEAYACESTQDIRNVVGGTAHVIFKGRIAVPPEGQKTDAQQLCRSLLLSDDATINAMPSLEIIADDVKCTHGATVADLDEEEFFYLLSRGIAESQAKALLIKGFAAALLADIDVDNLLPRSTVADFDEKLKSFFPEAAVATES